MKTKKPTFKDATDLGKNLREVDLEEMRANFKNNVEKAVQKSYLAGLNTGSVYGFYTEEDEIFAMCGVLPFSEQTSDFGIVWLLCTDKVEQHAISTYREIKKLLAKHKAQFPMMGNIMLEGSSNRGFVERLGFTFEDTTLEVGDNTFWRFTNG